MSQQLIDKVLGQLHKQVLNLLDDILAICPDESDILFVRLFFQNQIDSQYLMDEFVHWVYPWKKQILANDLSFFEENDHIFGPLPTDKVRHFKTKLKDGTFDESDIETIWAYFEVFVSLMDQYQKLK